MDRKKVRFSKAPTGIEGLDEITGGGFPKGRSTLICGDAGCGKTLMAMEFIVRGATEFNEPGVFVTFEETPDDLRKNVASLGFDLKDLAARRKLALEYVYIQRTEIEETGEYNLDGLFIRMGQAIDAIGAKRVALDTIEALFAGLPNEMILRAELRRLFLWLKAKGVTAVVTAERGEGSLTRHGLEEYVSDCVIVLDHRVHEQMSARRLRVVKYRGSVHGTNEYPFLIDESGISVLPITSLRLQHSSSRTRISSGLPKLDIMLGGKGFFRGSSILISGTAGTGKTSLAATFAESTCRHGGKALYLAFEESPDQVIRNMGSIGLDLKHWVDRDRLRIEANRPTLGGLETHLGMIHKTVSTFQPRVVILDPLSAFVYGENGLQVQAMVARLVDFLKNRNITTFITSLTKADSPLEGTDVAISSMIDTWILLRDIELNAERDRGLYILKSRGMAHSNQIREFRITSHGLDLSKVYVGPGGVLTGSARLAQEAQDRAAQIQREQDMELQQLELEQKRKTLELQIAALRAEFQMQEVQYNRLLDQRHEREAELGQDRVDMGISRHADSVAGNHNRRPK
jgi:circadian clock protein KaiC